MEELDESVWSLCERRPPPMYGAETWTVKKAQENKLVVTEMRMLRFMCGVTTPDRIRNERIRGTTKE